ncbi:hypothetical protein HanIR_Chr08g0342531 [Helianthus annuus]|nr:hypothetical protein HanIR_Chr08g0342531 [Helianthus annuus]
MKMEAEPSLFKETTPNMRIKSYQFLLSFIKSSNMRIKSSLFKETTPTDLIITSSS